MIQWFDILMKAVLYGSRRLDRTGVGTVALFAEVLRFDNSDAFPAVTTKRLAFNQCAAEMACFIQGLHDLDSFHRAGCTVWDGNGTDPRWVDSGGPKFGGDLGRIYGVQWRYWKSVGQSGETVQVDQLKNLVEGLKREPHSRRHIVTAWNPGEMGAVCLPPCPVLFQCYVARNRMDMAVYQRSCDLFLGLPFDVAGYALLQRLIAHEAGLSSGKLTFFLGDAHVYLNHLEQVAEVCRRKPLEPPFLVWQAGSSLFNFEPSHVRLGGYTSHGPVNAPLNV